MPTILNDPAKLESQASRISDLNADFLSQYTKMFEVVENLRSSWQGRDNVNFATTVTGYREDFEKIKAAIDDYVSFMNQAAKVYRETQQSIADSANRL